MSLIFGRQLRVSSEPFRGVKAAPLPGALSVAGTALPGYQIPDPKVFGPGKILPARFNASNLDQVQAALSSFANPALHKLTDIKDLGGSTLFKIAIEAALERKSKIGIFLDADMDGFMSAAVMHTALKGLNKTLQIELFTVDSPRREILAADIEKAALRKCRTVLFLDLGTYQNDAISYARQKGLETLVIDHHPSTDGFKSSANVFVNPIGTGTSFESYSSSHLSARLAGELGAGVESGKVAICSMLGILADGVYMTADNRKAVADGISMFNQSVLPFVRALKRVLNLSEITASDVTMKLVPLINSARRSKLMPNSEIVHFFCRANHREALELARKMEVLNTLRKNYRDRQDEVYQSEDYTKKIPLDNLVFVAKRQVGSTLRESKRLVKEHGKCAFVMKEIVDASDRVTEYSGSASAPAFDFINLFRLAEDQIIKRSLMVDASGQPDLKGHRHAAHIRIKADRIDQFIIRANYLLGLQITGRSLETFTEALIELPLATVKKDGFRIMDLIRAATEPTGYGFPEPAILLRDLRVGAISPVSPSYKHGYRIMLSQNRSGEDAMVARFFSAHGAHLRFGDRINILASIVPEDPQSKLSPQNQRAALLIRQIGPVSEKLLFNAS